MKTLKLLTLLLFTGQSLFAQTAAPQWVNVSPFPDDTNHSWGVSGSFVSAEEGWVIQGVQGKSHILYHTTDGAKTFNPIFSFPNSDVFFQQLQMLNSLQGYAIATHYFLHTADGGHTWQSVYDSSFFNQFLYPFQSPFYFIDDQTGFCNQYKDGGEMYDIYKTTDGAKSWFKTSVEGLEEAGIMPLELRWVSKFFFVDKNHGWAACYYATDGGVLLKTVNGGLTWTVAIPYGPTYFGIHFISPTKGGAVGYALSSNVYLTENNFESFSYENQGWEQSAETICYQNDSTIWISGGYGSFYRSINNGSSFELNQSYLENGADRIYNISFFDHKTGYAFGVPNKLMKYTDTVTHVNNTNAATTNFEVSPNPSSGKVLLKFNGKVTGTLDIYNSLGKKHISRKIENQDQLFIELNNMTDGIYLCVFTGNNKVSYMKKIIIQN